MNSIGKVSRWAGFSWFILWHVERVGRTDYADGTDMLALKRERGRDAQDLKKIDLENYRDLKVWKLKECPDAQRSSSARLLPKGRKKSSRIWSNRMRIARI